MVREVCLAVLAAVDALGIQVDVVDQTHLAVMRRLSLLSQRQLVCEEGV